jgi:hypothetical protein
MSLEPFPPGSCRTFDQRKAADVLAQEVLAIEMQQNGMEPITVDLRSDGWFYIRRGTATLPIHWKDLQALIPSLLVEIAEAEAKGLGL